MEARRKRSPEERAAIIAELRAPGAKVSAIARKHNVSASLLFRWRKQAGCVTANTGTSPERFVPVKLPAPKSAQLTDLVSHSQPSSRLIEIELIGGRRIRVEPSIDLGLLNRVAEALEGK